MKKVSLNQQLEEVQLVLKDSYPYLGGRKSMVEFRTDRMRAVARTLAWLQENEAAIRNYLTLKNSVGTQPTADPEKGRQDRDQYDYQRGADVLNDLRTGKRNAA